MRAHLVQTARTRTQLDRCERRSGTAFTSLTAEPLERAPRGHARLPPTLPGARRSHLAAADRDQRAVDLAGAQQRAAAKAPVALVDLVPLEGHRQRAVGLGRDGEQQYARGPAVQAVHDEDVTAQRLSHVFAQRALARGCAAPGNDDASRRFGQRSHRIIVV